MQSGLSTLIRAIQLTKTDDGDANIVTTGHLQILAGMKTRRI